MLFFQEQKDNTGQVATKQNDASLSAPQQGLQALQKLQVRSSQEIYWSYLEIGFPKLSMCGLFTIIYYNLGTHLKFNIAPKNIPSQKEGSLPTIIFQGLC